jgi:hypothetical protein
LPLRLRRHLDLVTWGEFFQRYCEARGARIGTQGRQSEKTDNVSVLAAELGVQERTARRRLEAARLPEASAQGVNRVLEGLPAGRHPRLSLPAVGHCVFDANRPDCSLQ